MKSDHVEEALLDASARDVTELKQMETDLQGLSSRPPPLDRRFFSQGCVN